MDEETSGLSRRGAAYSSIRAVKKLTEEVGKGRAILKGRLRAKYEARIVLSARTMPGTSS